MIQNISQLYGTSLVASDGDIGHIKDFYFDDKNWVIRYIVADTGSWLTGRQVLVSPHACGRLELRDKMLHVKLRKKQIQDSPSIETHRPVSRQYEIDYYRYYGWPAYWDGGAMWGIGAYPTDVPPAKVEMEASLRFHHRDDKHLQSVRAITGYHIQTIDGTIGHVSGFLMDDVSWAVCELLVETGHWYSGKKILVAPHAIERISYEDSTVFVGLTKADIQLTGENELAKAGAGNLGPGDSID
jgi:hypothetical protein